MPTIMILILKSMEFVNKKIVKYNNKIDRAVLEMWSPNFKNDYADLAWCWLDLANLLLRRGCARSPKRTYAGDRRKNVCRRVGMTAPFKDWHNSGDKQAVNHFVRSPSKPFPNNVYSVSWKLICSNWRGKLAGSVSVVALVAAQVPKYIDAPSAHCTFW